jgi:LysR family glycine cleavage system transcriptional activator
MTLGTHRRLPSLNALRTFEAAARKGSFKGAADELCVSHSAVSHQVKLLEHEIGVELFLRKPRSVELTRVGRAYYLILRDAFERIAEGTSLVRGQTERTTLTVQVYSTFAIRWLIPRMPDLQRRHPELKIRLHTSQSDVDFEHDDVDLCVMIGNRSSAGLRYDYLFSSRIFPVCSAATAARLSLGEAPSRLKDAPILQVYPSRRDWWVWLDGNGVDDVDPDSGQQFDSYELAMNSAMQGIGVALGMEPFVTRDLKAGLLFEPFPGRRVYTPGDWYLVCRDEKSDRPDVACFRQWLLDHVSRDGEMPPRRKS